MSVIDILPQWSAVEAIGVFLRVVGVLTLSTVVVIVGAKLVQRAMAFWWLRGNKAAVAVALNRRQIKEAFDVEVGFFDRSGRIRIAPKQTAEWHREGLQEELSNLVRTPLQLRFEPGHVRFVTPVAIPDTVNGEPSYNHLTGVLTVGIDCETLAVGTIKVKESSGVVVGALPGTGKTILLEAMRHAFGNHANVTYFDGKIDAAVDMTPALERLQRIMQQRLKARMDFWSGSHRKKLQVVIIDEAQRIFEAESSSKQDKADAEERKKLVTDLVRRGRSAGVLVVLASQRLSVDAIPSSIRDICGVRIAGRVARPEDAELVLGRRPGNGEHTPVELRRGRFVVDDGGEWREIQVYAPDW